MSQLISNYDQIKRKPGYDALSIADLPTTPRTTDTEAWLDRGQIRLGHAGIGRMSVGQDFLVGKGSYSWLLQNADCPWVVRDGPRLAYLGNRAYMFGGWNSLYGNPTYADPTWSGSITTNEVWATDDDGSTWTRIKQHATIPSDDQYIRRHTFGCVVKGGWIYIYGSDHLDGYTGGNSAVFRTQNGIDWEKMCEHGTPTWAGIKFGCYGALGDDLYQCGGQTDLADPNSVNNRVHRSSDNGVTWTELPSAPWAARGWSMHMPEFDGKLWLICGGRYANSHPSRVYYNDVWSFDGTTWTEELANGNGQLPAVFYNDNTVWNGRLWMTRGFNSITTYPGASAGNQSRIFSSEDGRTWEEVDAPLEPSHADGVTAGPNGILFAGGNYTINLLGKTARLLSQIGY